LDGGVILAFTIRRHKTRLKTVAASTTPPRMNFITATPLTETVKSATYGVKNKLINNGNRRRAN